MPASATKNNESIKTRIEICFNCGSLEHTLKNCLVPRNPNNELKFATCFICKQIGHISRNCQENPNGLYPNGGFCHICYQKTHLVKDCPNRPSTIVPDTSDNDCYSKDVNVKLNNTASSYNISDDYIDINCEDGHSNDDDNNDEDADDDRPKKKMLKHKNKLKKYR